MTAHTHGTPLAFVPAVFMWFAMMAVMMSPTAWPWVRAFQRLGGGDAIATARFAVGYLAAWLGYAVGVASLQWVFERVEVMSPSTDAVIPSAGALIFLVAGLYQFAPIKRACLSHCHTPFGYFLTKWRNGPMGALRMGIHHGLFCVGCCWALMATAFAVGMMNLWWMATLGLLAFAEQIAPQGQKLRRVVGAALVCAGLVRLGVFH
jgi:predicted metal-binding membrane protein